MAASFDEEGQPAVDTRSCPTHNPARGGFCTDGGNGNQCGTHTARYARHLGAHHQAQNPGQGQKDT